MLRLYIQIVPQRFIEIGVWAIIFHLQDVFSYPVEHWQHIGEKLLDMRYFLEGVNKLFVGHKQFFFEEFWLIALG